MIKQEYLPLPDWSENGSKVESVIAQRFWPRLVCSVLVNSDILTANYGVKQSQFTKPTTEPRASDSEESNEAFNRAIR